MSPAPRLPATTTIPEAVARLQAARAHLGFVTDTRDRVTGLVSLSDLLGELLNTRAPEIVQAAGK